MVLGPPIGNQGKDKKKNSEEGRETEQTSISIEKIQRSIFFNVTIFLSDRAKILGCPIFRSAQLEN